MRYHVGVRAAPGPELLHERVGPGELVGAPASTEGGPGVADPAFGEKQLALIDAVTTRLWSGLPFNQYDYLVFADIVAALEMPVRARRESTPKN